MVIEDVIWDVKLGAKLGAEGPKIFFSSSILLFMGKRVRNVRAIESITEEPTESTIKAQFLQKCLRSYTDIILEKLNREK